MNIYESENTKSKEELEIGIYLGIKKVQNKEEKEYFSISNNKTKFDLFDENKKTNEAITLNPNYIFEQSQYENCIMYENICRNTVNDIINQHKRHIFLTYGLTKTGKKTTIFGEENSSSNKNSRGLVFRLVEDLLNKINEKDKDKISLTYNFFCLFQNKTLDFSKLKSKDYENINEDDLIKQFETVKPTKDYELEMNRIPIFTIEDFISSVMKPLYMLYRLEPYDNKIFSRSSLILNIQLSNENENLNININNNSNNNNPQVKHTNICFCSMSSADVKIESQVFNLNKTRHVINTNADMINIIQLFQELNKNDFSIEKYFKNNTIPSYLVSVLKNNFLIKTNFKIIGCIFPAPYYYSKVKDTIMTLKRLNPKQVDRIDFQNNQEREDEENKEAMIYSLSKKLNDSEKEIEKKRNEIERLNEMLKKKDEENRMNMDIISKEIAFEGDISKLYKKNKEKDKEKDMNKDELIPEFKFVRKIRECMNHNIILQNKIKELEQKIENLKIEKEKIQIEKTVMENDNAMVTMYSKIKESNLLEENKLKLLLNNNKEKDALKRQVDTLTIQVELLKKEINEKTGLYRKLPETLKENLVNKEQLGQMKKEIKKKANIKLMNEIESLKKNHELELNNVRLQFEELIKQKNQIINQYENQKINNSFNSDKKIKEMIGELYHLNEIIEKIIKQYKKKFDMRKFSINTVTPGMFLKIKEEYDKDIVEISMNINKYNFPYLFESIKEFRVISKDEMSNNLIKMKKDIKFSNVYNSSLLKNNEKGNYENKSSMPLITK